MENNPSDNVCHSMAGESRPFPHIQDPSGVHSSPQATPPLGPSETLPATEAARSSTQAKPDISVRNKSPAKSKGRLRRRSEIPSLVESDIIEKALQPLTDEERRNWPGWVELESDPVRLILVYRHLGPTKTNYSRASLTTYYDNTALRTSKFRKFLILTTRC
jgi:ubiquitin carboxyl-terminal hydrolase L5